ncbi:Vacuolar protein-sorting-associated protein 36, partial [Coemansia sp. RSA 2320]
MEAVELAQTQRPVLDSGEKIVCVQNRVGLYKGDERDVDHDSGTVYLTTHRIVYVDQERPLERSVGLDLSRVLRSLLHSGFLYTSSKISLHLSAAPPAGRKRGLGGDGSQAGEGSGAGRPAHTRSQSSASARSWQCTICDCVNKGGGKCTLCGVPRPEGAAAKAPEVEMREATLRCPVCTFDNHTSMVQCEMCNSELWQPGPASSGSGSADAQAAGPEAAGGRGSVVKLSFRAGGASAFYSALREAIGGQAWVNGPAPALAAPGSVASGERRAAAAAAGGGISTIVSAAYESERARDVTLRSAFADLDALTAMADDI